MASEGQAVSAAGSELRTRIVSAIVLAPVGLAAMILGGLPFALLVTIVAAIAFWEWTGISGAVEPLWLRAGCAIGGKGGRLLREIVLVLSHDRRSLGQQRGRA